MMTSTPSNAKTRTNVPPKTAPAKHRNRDEEDVERRRKDFGTLTFFRDDVFRRRFFLFVIS